MKINDTITIHPYSQYRSICEKAIVEKIGRKWITLHSNGIKFKVTRFSIVESGLWHQ